MEAKLFGSRKAAAESPASGSNAAFLILLITLIIVFYILFLPPGERAALLDDTPVPGTPSTASGGYSHLVGSSPLQTRVGAVDYVKDAEIIHELNSFTIYTSTDASVITSVPSLYVKNSAFDKQTQELPFTLDTQASDNVRLTFNALYPSGVLKVYLNSVLLFEGSLDHGSSVPLDIPRDLLKRTNLLYFSVSSPGFAFWRVNQYELQNVIVTGDITDDSNSFNVQKVYLAQSEYEHLEQATLQFYPDCSGQVGRITILVNGERLFYGTPDCGIKNFVAMDKTILQEGENKIEFLSDSGSYIIDMVELESDLEDPEYPIYYFDLDEDLFTTIDNSENCGDIDGVCPDNCEVYDDKDCCFDESSKNYWCDSKTDNPRDRCVNMVLASQGNNCPAGYEDRSGDPPEDLEGLCGDDTDDFCPANCDYRYDKDCCYDISGAFWCEDVPFTGLDSTCTTIVTPAECDACPDGYRDEDNDRPNCPTGSSSSSMLDEPELKSGVDIIFKVYFATQDYKKVDFIINGKTLPVDTYNMLVERNINSMVQEGANSVEIQPRRDVTISQLKVAIE